MPNSYERPSTYFSWNFPQKNQFLHFFWTGFLKKYKSYLNNKNLFGKKCLLKIWSHT